MSREVLLRETFLDDEKSPVAHAAPKIVYDYLKKHEPEEKFTLREVYRVYRQAGAPQTVVYKLRDLLGEEIQGVFYRPQLQKVLLSRKPVISRIVRKSKGKGYLVQLMNYPSTHRIWLTKTEIKDGYTLGENIRLAS